MQVTYTTLHPQAMHAIRAAECWHIWGAHAARQYARRHGVPHGLLRLARQLRAANRWSF